MKSITLQICRLILGITVGLFSSIAIGAAPSSGHCPEWPLWKAYLERFVQPDGRVIDFQGERNYTTSEGQAYSLFFALVANDRSRFDTLLNWTQYNLAEGDLKRRLPAWHWGKRDDGKWTMLDPNPASDSDMWLAYTLLQAGKLWQQDHYTELGKAILALIKKEEVVDLPDFGPMVLPGSYGFVVDNDKWRINPSYLSLQLLRAFAVADKSGPWEKIADNTVKLLRSTSPLGFTPDWAVYQAGKGWIPDLEKGPIGSYDAIRVYLWAGMLDDADPAKRTVLQTVSGMHKYLSKNDLTPPEKINTQTGKAEGNHPPGFSAALLPYLHTLKDTKAVEKQMQHVKGKNNGSLIGEDPKYYDQVLALFGLGAMERRFRFDANGQLIPNWKNGCSH